MPLGVGACQARGQALSRRSVGAVGGGHRVWHPPDELFTWGRTIARPIVVS